MISRCLSEFVGTFALVFAGAGAIVVDAAFGGVLGHLGICIVFGLIVMASGALSTPPSYGTVIVGGMTAFIGGLEYRRRVRSD